MNKTIFSYFLFSIFAFQNISAQSITSGKRIDFSIVCSGENIVHDRTLDFVLSITNNYAESIIAPSDFIIGPWNCKGCSIVYEILFCASTDTINVVDGNSFVDQLGKVDSINIKGRSTHSFSASIFYSPSYFERKGLYKIRFILKRDALSPAMLNDISSKWVLFQF